jgi:hypothetical protein
MQARSAVIEYSARRSIPSRLLVALVALAVVGGVVFVVDGYLDSTQTFSSARELVDTATQGGVRCQDPSLTETKASCLIGGRFASFHVFDSRRDKREMITAIRDIRRDGGGGNHLVIGDRWAILTTSERVAHRLGAALGGRVDIVESNQGRGETKKKR